MSGLTKRYGAVVACDRVDFRLMPGRIQGVLGENGAGKSTLMKILIGLVLPDEGSIYVRGERTVIADPLHAAQLGIGMVHQHFSLVDALTVWENVALGEPGALDPGRTRSRVSDISLRYGLDIAPEAVVGELTPGMRQRVEIIKCLARDPEILIFDEPTSVLTPAESEQLFDVLRTVVREENRAVALVSHKLDEIMRATDEVTIMRAGQVVDSMSTTEAEPATLARAMVGRNVSLRREAAAIGAISDVPTPLDQPMVPRREGPPALEITGAVAGEDGTLVLDHLDLRVWPGEVVGVAGVEGNGQKPLADLLSSLLPLDEGSVVVSGREVPTGRAGAMARAGVGVIPEDRHDSGCVLEMSVAENLVLADPESVSHRGVLDRRALALRAQELIDDFEIRTPGPDAPLWQLSGGNQQRVVLARELSHRPAVLVASQPTRGLDVGAIEYMNTRIKEAAESGVGVLLISSELEEIAALSSRIVVMYEGRIVGEMERADLDLERLGMLMGGAGGRAE